LFILPHINPIHRLEQLASQGTMPIFGQALRKKMRQTFFDSHTLEYEVFSRPEANAETFVTLDPSLVDPLGLPAARIHLGELALEQSNALVRQCRAVLDQAGAVETTAPDGERRY